MSRLIGAVMLVGLCAWIIADPTVAAEFIHAVFCRCLGLDDERAQREHQAAMDAMEKASRR